MSKHFIFLVSVSFLFNCQKHHTGPIGDTSLFENIPVPVAITPGFVDEASGMIDCKSSPGFLWIEQDSGNPPDLCLLSYDAKTSKKIHLKGLQNRDWEDIAAGGGPQTGTNYLYLADIGDNSSVYETSYIYRFPEPAIQTDTVFAIDKISFRYPGGSKDAEAIMVDKKTKDIFIVSKREATSKLYKLSYPQSTTQIMMASLVGELPFTGVVSASLSASGREIILKTYTNLYYWKRSDNETIEAALKKPFIPLAYQMEPQGEAVCFRNDNSGFFTISEKPIISSAVNLNFYKRK